MTNHTITYATYLWNYIVELTFDDGRKAAFDFERTVKSANDRAVARYADMRLFRIFTVIENGRQIAWDVAMVLDANWLYALMPEATFIIEPTPTINVDLKF